MNVVRVIRSGLATTVQDLGRPHLRHFGIVSGGAMDRVSHELANRLVGNSADAATLEMTLTGDELEWTDDSVIAITGANLCPVVTSAHGEETLVPQHRPVLIRGGTRIRFQTAVRGCRCSLAVAGGIDVPIIMGSRSTYLRAGIGGHRGRMLQSGDELSIASSDASRSLVDYLSHIGTDRPTVLAAPAWFVRPVDLPSPDSATLRAIRGVHFSRLTEKSRASFWTARFSLSPQSDRMGYRLSDRILETNAGDELISEGVTIGTIQLPPDGNSILLMADSAPTGGYPRLAHVIAADLSIAGQLRPGQSVQFQEVSLEQAHTLLRRQRKSVQRALAMTDILCRS